MDGYRKAVALLPSMLQHPLLRVDHAICRRVQEIRLRAGQAVSIGLGGERWYVCENGTLSAHPDGFCCTQQLLQQTVDRLSSYSLYAHGDDLRHGFITADGCRVGIVGTAVTERGEVVGYRHLTGLCIRVARVHRGCADAIASILCDGVHSALILSEPSGGKTSLLRDLACAFAERRLPVTVVDERFELGDCGDCDVLRGTPKTVGILQAVRCLAPRAVLIDELGDGAELAAVREAALRGVPTIATAHCRTPHELMTRGGLRTLLESGVFEYVILLHGRNAPGQIRQIVRTEEWLNEACGDRVAYDRRRGLGRDDATAAGTAHRLFNTGEAADPAHFGAYSGHRRPDR